MSTRLSKGWWIAISCVIVVFQLAGQTAGTGALTGTVTDASGAVIANVMVTATNTETGQERVTTTGGDGSYKFTLLPPGTYRVKFVAAGFRMTEVPSVRVDVTETPVLDRSLEVGAQAEQFDHGNGGRVV